MADTVTIKGTIRAELEDGASHEVHLVTPDDNFWLANAPKEWRCFDKVELTIRKVED